MSAVAACLPQGKWAQQCVLICSNPYWMLVGLLAAWHRQLRVVLPPYGHATIVDYLAAQPNTVALLHDAPNKPGINISQCTSTSQHEKFQTPHEHTHVLTVYTSGTTGHQQGIAKSYGQLMSEVNMHMRHHGIHSTHVLLSTVPPYHLYGLLFSVLLPWRSGATLVRGTPLHAESIADSIKTHGVTHFISTPAHLDGLRVLASHQLHLQETFSSGAPLSPHTAETYTRISGHAPLEILGSTETGGIASKRYPDTCWTLLPGVHAHTTDTECLCVHSAYASGSNHHHETFDRVTMQSEKTFVHHGRADDVIKISGRRVHLNDILHIVRAMPGVQDAEACVRSITTSRQQEILLVAESNTHRVDDIRSYLAHHLDPTSIPKKIMVIERLCRNSMGKLPHRVIESMFDARSHKNMPLIHMMRSSDEEHYDGDVLIPYHAWPFEGHFITHPVFPGAALLHYGVAHQAITQWPALKTLQGATRIKFTRIVGPGQVLELHMQRKDHKVNFNLQHRDEVCASGTLVFA